MHHTVARTRFGLEGIYIYIYFFFSVFQPGAAFLAICCILELKSVFCVHFGARISHLRAHLAFGFWLWLLALASLGFTWLMAHGFWLLAFGFGVTWLWFWPFTSLGSWRLLGFGIVVCI